MPIKEKPQINEEFEDDTEQLFLRLENMKGEIFEVATMMWNKFSDETDHGGDTSFRIAQHLDTITETLDSLENFLDTEEQKESEDQ